MSEERMTTVVICRACRHEKARHDGRGCGVQDCRCLASDRRLLETNDVMIAQRRNDRQR